VLAAHTLLPVFGVPMGSALNGLDSLLSTVQMPGGVPVGTLAIGKAGAVNAALLAVRVLALTRPELRERLERFAAEQAEKVLAETLPPGAETSAPYPVNAGERTPSRDSGTGS
jgi:5-(carboxyamino)imidazole ribonucleotide mutase